MRREYAKISVVIVFLISSNFTIAQNNTDKKVNLTEWLVAGPVEAAFPVLNAGKNEIKIKDLLEFEQIFLNKMQPREGEKINWDNQTKLKWKKQKLNTDFIEIERSTRSDNPQIAFCASYINVDRWMKVKLEINSYHLFQVFLDGNLVASKTEVEKKSTDSVYVKPGSVNQEVKLENGKHLLLVKMMYAPQSENPWTLSANLSPEKNELLNSVSVTTNHELRMSMEILLDATDVSNVSLSADGELAALSYSKVKNREGAKESWTEIRRVKDGKLQQSYKGEMKISSLKWAPAGKKYSYLQKDNNKTNLWIADVASGLVEPLLKDVENFDNYSWAPNGEFIIYGITQKAEENKSGLKKVEGMPDHWPTFRDRTFLYQVTYPQGVKKRLTAGDLSTHLYEISPDSKKLLFSTVQFQFEERPYSTEYLIMLNLQSLTIDSIWNGHWLTNVKWSPDGKNLLLLAGPSSFGEIGKNVSQNKIPNDYDAQAYIFNLASKKVEAISRDFNPSTYQAVWHGKYIYFNTRDGSYRHLFRYNPNSKRYKLLETGLDVIDQFDVAQDMPVIIYRGSGATQPEQVFVMNLENEKYRLSDFPAKAEFSDVVFGKVEQWNFKNKNGQTIFGRIHYPPGFDSSKKYPVIVYYYGGVSPTARDFGGRYPKNYYAANGYVVYVLQPSGCFGYGQEFSSIHVNDWGKIVAEDIIDGVQQFVAAHNFADAQKIGCLGASYGGFLSMLLPTRSDVFAAAVSHAGISSISSYWGEGFWGYLYNSVAAANSFPWNRKDIYIEQSPLFSADKINTPLLLLHGDADTNVPRGESRQLYTALKLLGKEVELIEVADQNHWILDYPKRLRWKKSIMAWFDKWLKDQPEWWNDLYSQN